MRDIGDRGAGSAPRHEQGRARAPDIPISCEGEAPGWRTATSARKRSSANGGDQRSRSSKNQEPTASAGHSRLRGNSARGSVSPRATARHSAGVREAHYSSLAGGAQDPRRDKNHIACSQAEKIARFAQPGSGGGAFSVEGGERRPAGGRATGRDIAAVSPSDFCRLEGKTLWRLTGQLLVLRGWSSSRHWQELADPTRMTIVGGRRRIYNNIA